MHLFTNPAWLTPFRFDYARYEDIPDSVFDAVNRDLDRVQSSTPAVSVMIAAYNEEVNILRCLASLSKQKTTVPFEIIVINNNSADKTQQTLDRLHVKSLFEKKQGCGPARQFGQENAAGTYILLADADCFYPDCWVDKMMKVLAKPGVVCVYGRYSFISEPGFPRWKLALLEVMKDAVAEFRQIKRPYLNAYGISMGYVKEYGLKVGFIITNFWGDDGRLCLDLMPYGKVRQVRSNKARAWTGPRTLQRSGTFGQALVERVWKELSWQFSLYFSQRQPTDLDDPKFAKKTSPTPTSDSYESV
ncbi:glycosyltransferase family 2 protein [Spirosoma montaniterrae]|uniref:glycosyltransferase family 2 protein n=1 Tax=Spirosoma montaniterrae TaxID=1178516 RepID=UPI00097DEB1C|nr:glycosyltransferase family 2 protein [Spirosoma montaniterrae]